jgi:hypothetical protein
VLEPQVVSSWSAPKPIAVLEKPPVTLRSAFEPAAVLPLASLGVGSGGLGQGVRRPGQCEKQHRRSSELKHSEPSP